MPVGVGLRGGGERGLGDGDDVGITGLGVDGHVGLFSEGGELLDGGGASNVARAKRYGLSLLRQVRCKFGGGRRLAGAL